MSRILFSCNAVLVRNNGIVRFMIDAARILRRAGHTVDFVTDNITEIDIAQEYDNYYAPHDNAVYPDLIRNGLPHILYLPHISNRIRDVFREQASNNLYDIVIGNDVHSTSAFVDLGINVIHYTHTAALLGEKNYTFLSDSYLQMEKEVMQYCRVGVPTQYMVDKFADFDTVHLGLPLDNWQTYYSDDVTDRQGVLFLGEGSLRKGADTFVNVMRQLDLPVRLAISATPEEDFSSLENTVKAQFLPHEEAQKINFIKQSRLMYFPSRSETVSYSVMESLLSQPVLISKNYEWNVNARELGAIEVDDDDAVEVIQKIYNQDYLNYSPDRVVEYLERTNEQWNNLAKDI